MLNADRLRDLRRGGYQPELVYIDLDFPMRHTKLTPFNPRHPHLHIGPSENVVTLDLRVMSGLTVQINGFDADRLATVTVAMEEAGAARVITVLNTTFGEGEFETIKVAAVADTKGVLTWPAN